MTDSTAATKNMDDIVALCRRRGFIFQSSEIYGGINGFWDYGPLGTELKRNLKNAWWEDIVHGDLVGPDGQPLEIVGVDCTIIMHPKVWEASGHVSGFNDPMVDDKKTNRRYRADQLFVFYPKNASEHERFGIAVEASSLEEAEKTRKQMWESGDWTKLLWRAKEEFDFDPLVGMGISAGSARNVREFSKIYGPKGEGPGEWDVITADQVDSEFRARVTAPDSEYGALMEPRLFNLMFETYIGAIRDEDAKAYLRPETAQGIFTQFWNVVDTSRVKVPFGIAQVGKAFRNEVTPRNFTFRSREFEQMEIEFFIPHPEHLKEGGTSAVEWYQYWRDQRFAWWQSIGLAGDNLILREHDRDELAHYATEGVGTSDVEYRFPFTAPGFGELEGVSHRTDFDLRQHANYCGKGEKLRYYDQERDARYFPHVIEPSAGADRGTLALLCEAYTPTPDRKGSKAIMRFTPRMAPIKAGVFPLVGKEGMPEVAEQLYRQLKKKWTVQYDVKQSIGKRYARMDEAGTPYCFTVDGQTLEDQTVTLRERDTGEQRRMAIDQVEAFLTEKMGE